MIFSLPGLLFSFHLNDPQALISQGAFSALEAGLATATGLLPIPELFFIRGCIP